MVRWLYFYSYNNELRRSALIKIEIDKTSVTWAVTFYNYLLSVNNLFIKFILENTFILPNVLSFLPY